ncbi:hypothetical protein [Microbacterium aurantiacum]|uniref:hypothetical protein n=1 Tax=Microbacterium aurantiacum TaxID=162393 RepID=UPI003D763AF3
MLTDYPLPRSTTKRDRLGLGVGDVYVYRKDPSEHRATIEPSWIESQSQLGVRFLGVLAEDREWVTVEVNDDPVKISLFDSGALSNVVRDAGSRLWIDITGLELASWAPWIRSAIEASVPVRALYTEPARYSPSPSPVERLRFNLSKRTMGPAPLPGFARLTLPAPEDAILVPFMGFEGERLQRVLGELPYEERRTFPVLGIPGFKMDYPFHSLEANAHELARLPLHRNVRLARANCPFESFLAVTQVASDEAIDSVVLAPIGTKPHALGALLYAIVHPAESTLVYDHPVRSDGRTEGAGPLNVYDLSAFLNMLEEAA